MKLKPKCFEVALLHQYIILARASQRPGLKLKLVQACQYLTYRFAVPISALYAQRPMTGYLYLRTRHTQPTKRAHTCCGMGWNPG